MASEGQSSWCLPRAPKSTQGEETELTRAILGTPPFKRHTQESPVKETECRQAVEGQPEMSKKSQKTSGKDGSTASNASVTSSMWKTKSHPLGTSILSWWQLPALAAACSSAGWVPACEPKGRDRMWLHRGLEGKYTGLDIPTLKIKYLKVYETSLYLKELINKWTE